MVLSDATDLMTLCINDTISRKLASEDYDYDYFLTLEHDENGNVTAVRANMARINAMSSELLSDIVKAADGGELSLAIPIGNLLGSSLLLGRGFTSGEAGIFASIRCFAGILAQPLLGGWADRHPEVPIKRLLNACLVLALGVNVVFYTTRPGFWGTALIFLTLGILELNAYPLLDSMAVQFIAAGVDMSYSLSRGLGSLSYALACVACGQQAVRFGTESLLLTHMALLVLMIAVVALYPAFPKDALQAQGGGERPHSILYILKSSRPFTLTLVSLFFTLAAIMPIVSFMVNLVSDRGGDEGHLGLALFLMGASELPAALLFTPLFRRFGAAGTLRMSICFMAVKPLLFLLAPGLSGLLLVQPVQLLGYGLFTPASVYYANANVFPVDQVKGQSIMMIASNGLGAMFGNFLAGYAIDWGGADAMLGMCLVFGVIGVLFMLAAGRSKT